MRSGLFNLNQQWLKRFPAKRLLNTAEALAVKSPEEKQNMENAPTDIFWKITVQRVTSSIHFTFYKKVDCAL